MHSTSWFLDNNIIDNNLFGLHYIRYSEGLKPFHLFHKTALKGGGTNALTLV